MPPTFQTSTLNACHIPNGRTVRHYNAFQKPWVTKVFTTPTHTENIAWYHPTGVPATARKKARRPPANTRASELAQSADRSIVFGIRSIHGLHNTHATPPSWAGPCREGGFPSCGVPRPSET